MIRCQRVPSAVIPTRALTRQVSGLSVDPKLLDIICCPVTRVPLEVMPEARLQELNRRIQDARLVSRDGTVIAQELTAALVTRDGKLAYPVDDGIPVLLEGHGIVLSQLEGS